MSSLESLFANHEAALACGLLALLVVAATLAHRDCFYRRTVHLWGRVVSFRSGEELVERLRADLPGFTPDPPLDWKPGFPSWLASLASNAVVTLPTILSGDFRSPWPQGDAVLERVRLRKKLPSGRVGSVRLRPVITLSVECDDALVIDASADSDGAPWPLDEQPLHRFFVTTSELGAVRRASWCELKAAIERCWSEYSAVILRSGGGELSVNLSSGPRELPPERYESALAQLDRIASWFDRTSVDVRGLGPRRGIRASDGGACCAFCRVKITGSEADLVACETCRTVVHASCRADQGRCPVVGCESP